MWGPVLTGGKSHGAQGAAPLPGGMSQGCHPCKGRSCPHPCCPPSSSPKASAEPGLKCFTSDCASPGKTVCSNPLHSSSALLQVRFTPQEPCRCLLPPEVTNQCLPQLHKTRCDKSKTNPRPPRFLNEISLFLGKLVQSAISQLFKVVYKSINP